MQTENAKVVVRQAGNQKSWIIEPPVIYLDNNATTKPYPNVLVAAYSFFSDRFGNPSSLHRVGRAALRGLEEARGQVATLLRSSTDSVVFTSGGTEANNLAISSALQGAMAGRNEIVISEVEHPSVFDYCQALSERMLIRQVRVDSGGVIDLGHLKELVNERTAVVSIMMANNETGVLMPVKEACEIAHKCGAFFHTDGVQALGKVPLDVVDLGVDYASFSAHKIHGLKGAGALYCSDSAPRHPLLVGGKQEYSIRAGTENVVANVAFGAACVFAEAELNECARHIAALRNKLEEGIVSCCENVVVNGVECDRLPNTLSVCFKYLSGTSIVLALDRCGICASAGSACSASASKVSRVMSAMKRSYCEAYGAVRFSLSALTTEKDIDYVLGVLPVVLHEQKKLSPFLNPEDVELSPLVSFCLDENEE